MVAAVGKIDKHLYQFCTVRQLEILETIDKAGSLREAARKLGVNFTVCRSALEAVKVKAAQSAGYSPEHGLTAKGLPPGYVARGISLHVDKEGKPANYWLKGTLDSAKHEEQVKLTIHALIADIKGIAPAVPEPSHVLDELLSVYPMGDPHFGMYAWAQEAGEDFDLAEAKRLTLGAVDRLVQVGPASGTAILLPLGDVFHADDQSNLTPAHKHPLDVDSRYPKVIQVGVQTYRHAIQRLLEKHQRVIVRFVRGNHDPHAIWALSYATAAFFEGEPRVTVDTSPALHWYYRFGKVLIGATHGDTTKHKDLLGVMASDRAADWGQTVHRYFYTGHIHHQMVTELPGLLCESFRTLAARDAYATGAGYRAGRDMRLIVHHREDGEIERYRCDASRII